MPWRIALARSTNSFSMLVVVLSVPPWTAVQAKPQARGGGPIICGCKGGDEGIRRNVVGTLRVPKQNSNACHYR
jgi:hypothetical protein